MEKQHSVFGGSTADRWLNCPGSVKLIEEVRPLVGNESSEDAFQGTYAHFLAALELERWRAKYLVEKRTRPLVYEKAIIPNPLNKNWQDSGKDMHPDDEMLDAIWVYISTIISDMATAGAPPRALFVEQEFVLGHISEDAYGTCDAGFVWNGVLYIYDFKYGVGNLVWAYENRQGLYYAVGAVKSLTPEQRKTIRKIVICIIQPRTYMEEMVTRFETTMQRIVEFSQSIRGAMADALVETPRLEPGSWCDSSYCSAKPFCPALQEGVREVMPYLVSGQVVDANTSVNQISHVLKIEEQVTGFLKAVKELAKEMANHGVKIPEFKLVQTSGKRGWGDKTKAIKFLEQHIKDQPVIKPAEPITIGDAEKLLKKFKVIIPEELTPKSKGGTALVHESDKRPEIVTIDVASTIEVPALPESDEISFDDI